MGTLKIHRINKTRYQVRNGKEVVRECSSFREALNATISEDLLLLDSVNDFCDTELEDYDIIESYREVA